MGGVVCEGVDVRGWVENVAGGEVDVDPTTWYNPPKQAFYKRVVRRTDFIYLYLPTLVSGEGNTQTPSSSIKYLHQAVQFSALNKG